MTEPAPPAGRFWRRIFQHTAEPVFLLNRNRRLIFVNRAWEELTGLSFAAVRRLPRDWRRRPVAPGSAEAVTLALRPPPEVLAGQVVHVRRLFPVPDGAPHRWRVTFMPFRDAAGTVGVLGKIQPLPATAPADRQPLPEKLIALRDRHTHSFTPDYLDSDLPVLQRLGDQVRLAAQTCVPVLFVGETGAGKQWLARLVHQQAGTDRPFVALDAERLPTAVLAALLFGEPGLLRRGHAGTLYLREPAALPRDLQEQLSQWLHAGTAADAPRLLAGCRGDPRADVAEGRLLEELYCGLSTLTVAVPPLRDRLADLDWLCERLLERAADGTGAVPTVSPAALDLLRGHRWPGNLRELFNVLADAAGRAAGRAIEPGDLPMYLRPAPPPVERRCRWTRFWSRWSGGCYSWRWTRPGRTRRGQRNSWRSGGRGYRGG